MSAANGNMFQLVLHYVIKTNIASRVNIQMHLRPSIITI